MVKEQNESTVRIAQVTATTASTTPADCSRLVRRPPRTIPASFTGYTPLWAAARRHSAQTSTPTAAATALAPPSLSTPSTRHPTHDPHHTSTPAMATPAASRSRFLISESALKLSLTPAPSATPTGSVSSASSASSASSSSFAVRRKQFRPTTVPADQAQPRVHSESPSLVSLGIVLVVSGAHPDPYVRRSLKRPFRAIDREPKDRDGGPPREQPRYRPPPPDMPLPVRRRLRPTHALTRKLPLYHPSRPLRDLPPLPTPVDVQAAAPEPQATRSSARTRRPPPRNLEHLIVAVSNTARTRERERDKDRNDRERSPAKKRKVVVLATDEMDVDVDVPAPAPVASAPVVAESGRSSSRSSASKKKAPAPEPTPMIEDTPPVEELETGKNTRRVTRRGKDISVTPTPPPPEPAKEAPSKSQSSRAPARKSRPSKTGSEAESTPAATPVPPAITRRTSARRSGGGDGA
ncbi:hypothetical protein FS749_008808 [Ceratobasidium sp. UAMH 11750]|nr:hypothetical protein FS749_008808 [Ceratobasidium sp. UAMH 11750]